MTHQVDLLLPESVAKIVRHRDRVGYRLLHRHGFGWNVRPVGESGAAPRPPADGEEVFETHGISLREEILRHAGPAVKEQQHRVRRIPARDEGGHSHVDDACHDGRLQQVADRLHREADHGCEEGEGVSFDVRTGDSRTSHWVQPRGRIRPSAGWSPL
jgi:hypothetical protein